MINEFNKNTGNYNSGNCNNGNRNSGNHNSGDYNSGNCNSDDFNSGHYNSGYRNSGNYNSGDHNSGNRNSGNHNSGYYNSGDYNSGDFNKANHCTGCFNTVGPKNIYLFNKPSKWTYEDWVNSKAYKMTRKIETLVWIELKDMTKEEKEARPEYITTGGYLKKIDTFEACQNWWDKLSEEEKAIIKDIPNFDKEIFKDITGIEV